MFTFIFLALWLANMQIAAAATGQAAADAFNAALGVSSAPAATPAAAAAAAVHGECVAPNTADAPVNTAPIKAATPEAAAQPASGTNVQTFTGTLGGAAPPVIFTAGAARPFAVDGTTDINKAAAIQRSCSVQHNNCANAANSGKLAGGVAQCDAQLTDCNAGA
jgi:hypothetical protein